MRNLFTLLFFCGFIFSAQAQQTDGTIRGKLVDTLGQQPLSDATISILRVSDSSLVTFTLSNKQGSFEIKGLAEGNYRLIISHQSFEPFSRLVTVSSEKKGGGPR